MGAEPGAQAHDERRPRHRHPRGDAGPRPRHQAVRPADLGIARPALDGSQSQEKANAGVDLFYNPTPGVRANLTINTDFAQTEVDQRQVNLTRFSLFFPERRDFFLDGATFFDFASDSAGGPQIQPFFSRRIGLSADATPQKIDFGTKFTGQMGGQDVGFLQVRTGDEDGGFIPEDFTVARVKRRVLQQSYFGAIYTRRDARTGDARFDYRAPATRPASTLAWPPRSSGATRICRPLRGCSTPSPPGVTGSQQCVWRRHRVPERPLAAAIRRPRSAAELRPVRRASCCAATTGVTARRSTTDRDHRTTATSGAYEYDANLEVVTNLRNQLLERILNLTVYSTCSSTARTTSASRWTRATCGSTVPSPSPRASRCPLGAEYRFTRFAVRGQTANRRLLALNGRFETGGFYSGHRDQTVLGLTVRARPGYIFSLNGEWNQIDLAEGSFASNVFRGVADTQFSPFMAIVNIIQFDTVSRVLGWQSRYRWILKPGNDLYVVYTHNWVEDPVRGPIRHSGQTSRL